MRKVIFFPRGRGLDGEKGRGGGGVIFIVKKLQNVILFGVWKDKLKDSEKEFLLISGAECS